VIPLGTVIYRGQDLNPLRGSSHCFWIDGLGQAHIEAESSLPTSGIYLALGGFGRLLNSGSLVPSAGGTKAPRTILGIDGTGTRLWIAVIDGRQPGYSVGLTLEESAQFLLDHTGAVEALNMDGGGSSSFVSLLASGEHLVMNRPSDVIGPRAVAVYLQYY
jgi:exopolysaccharide biosynthesis protein